MNEATKEYREKETIGRAAEPEGRGEADRPGSPVWVIREHDASSHPFDLRIEVDGVLKSWAVPKGPSTDPSEKRLALPTGDHPLEPGASEGGTPEDEHGGGTIVVWDRGTYTNLKVDNAGDPVPVSDQIADGHITVRLDGGEKLAGGFALIRMQRRHEDSWLLVKMDDDAAVES